MGMYFDMTGIDHQPLEIRLLYHRFQHFFPDALVSPATETPLDSIPLTIFRRQVSPWCSRSQNPEHAIQKLTGILCVPSPRSLVSYCVRLENFPHRIGHIVPSIAVLHEETPLCVFLHYTTKRHFCRQCLGMEPIAWYTEAAYWPYILVITQLWKTFGYNSIIYYATIVGIDQTYYEAAIVDGATWWKQVRFITLPMLKPVIVTLTLLAIGRMFYSDFGLFYQVPMNIGLLYDATNTIDTYVYRGLLETNDVGRASAAGFIQSVMGFFLVLGTNAIVRRVDREQALF